MNNPSTTILERTRPSISLAELPAHPAIHPSIPPATPAAQLPGPALQFTSGPLALAQNPASGKKRNGKVAQLPKPEREMVNLMLHDNYPYWQIESALHHRGFTISQRNISNWKTRGGFNEWCAAQAQALELRLFQDNLTDLLRRHDAAELAEVGLQSAATNLSAILLRPDLMRELLADPEKYSKLIELQCRLTREIHPLQKNRDQISKIVGGNPERLKRQHEAAVDETRKLICATTDPLQGHCVLPENFTHKHLDPVLPCTFAEKEHARTFENLFKPGPDNPLTKTKALPPAPPPVPNTQPHNPKNDAPAAPPSTPIAPATASVL